MNNILCPIDFSDASLTAVEFATKIAQAHRTSVKLLHVITDNEYSENLGKSSSYIENIEEQPAKKLKSIIEAVNAQNPIGYDLCTMQVTEGDLVDQIITVATDEKISLIVMGTTGVSDVNEARVGSNTVKVIEHTEIPVVCIPEGIPFHSFDRIVYGSSFSSDDREFLQPILNFAVPFDARIYAVHISGKGEEIDEKAYGKYVKEMESYFVYEKLGFEQFATEMDTGIALEHMLNVHDAHLLILVHKRRNFIGSLFHRSLTKRMSYLTNFPMLVLRN